MNEMHPPCAVELEQEVVAIMLINEHMIPAAATLLRDRDFYNGHYRILFEGLKRVYQRAGTADFALLKAHLIEVGKWEVIGGNRTLSKCMDRAGTSSHLEQYAQELRSRTIQRDILDVCAEASATIALQEDIDIEDRLRSFDALVRRLYEDTGVNEMADAKQCAREHHEMVMAAANEDGFVGISTGLTALDRELGGLRAGWQVLVMAASGVGKSAFAINNLALSALRAGKPVAIFALEMSRQEVFGRMVAAVSGVPYHVQSRGEMTEKDLADYTGALGYVETLPMWIDEGDATTIEQLCVRCRALQHQLDEPIGMIVVDYIQLIESGKRHSNRTEELSAVSRALKRLAKELKTVVVVLSQPTVSSARESKDLSLADARGSQSIGADVDLALILNRDKEGDRIRLAAGKFRHGPTFALTEDDIRWRGGRMMFDDKAFMDR